MSTQLQKYVAAQTAFVELFNIKKGSRVKVLRKGEGNGWTPPWNREMDKLVGKTLTVINIDANRGIQIHVGYYWFPFFVLEVVGSPLPDPIPLTPDNEYLAEFKDNGDINVSGITVPYETLKDIFDKATKVIG